MKTIELILICQAEGKPYWVTEPNVAKPYYTEINRKDFIIPEGYSVEECTMGTLEFYDEKERRCELFTTEKTELPFLITDQGRIILKSAENTYSKIKDLRKDINFTQKEFAEYFGVKLRTIENWESERGSAPEYIINLMEYKLKNEGFLRSND